MVGLALRCWISISAQRPSCARSPKPTDIKRLQLKMSDIEQFIEKAGSVLTEFKGDPNLITNVDETFRHVEPHSPS
jgi:hypothetical protein